MGRGATSLFYNKLTLVDRRGTDTYDPEEGIHDLIPIDIPDFENQDPAPIFPVIPEGLSGDYYPDIGPVFPARDSCGPTINANIIRKEKTTEEKCVIAEIDCGGKHPITIWGTREVTTGEKCSNTGDWIVDSRLFKGSVWKWRKFKKKGECGVPTP